MADVRRTRRYRKVRAIMFRMFGTVCHICGHEGAREADHLVPVSQAPGQVPDPTKMRPAHGALYRSRRTGEVLRDNRCPTCGRACNQSRGNRSVESAQERSGLAAPVDGDYTDPLLTY